MTYTNSNHLIQNITLRQLQIFEAVVRLEGYTRAAEALHLTQPTISMQIKKLSQTIGSPLFDKGNNRITTTAVGKEVYLTAQNILGNLMSLDNAAAALDGMARGPLRIAVITTAKYFMPHLLDAFITKHPEVQPILKVTNRSRVLQRLKSNLDDLLIMGQVPNDLNIEAYPFVNNELVVVASTSHPLTQYRSISLQQLSKERFVVRETGSGTRAAVDRLFAKQGLKIQPYMELGSSEAIKQAVMAGLGISVLSRHNLQLERAGDHIAILDVNEFPLFYRWYAVHLKDKKLSFVTRTFLDFLMKQGKDMMQYKPEKPDIPAVKKDEPPTCTPAKKNLETRTHTPH